MEDRTIRIQDTITVETTFGKHTIELCYGDITALPMEEKVDIVMTSAFIGDYSNARGTLIGALHHNLGISTRELSRDKAMDLRIHYSCWFSKDLSPDVPFRRLLCFEKTRGSSNQSLTRQIRDIFKVLVPILKNQTTTIITPLLATGNQGSNKTTVLQATVQGAISWIQAGLPMKKLKIVLYEAQNKELNKCFSSLKEKHIKMQRKEKKFDRKYDIFFVYQSTDSAVVKTLTKNLQAKKSGLIIYSTPSKFDDKDVWQQGIFDLMMGSKRIVPVLTPNFVGNDDCLETFNMAICCTRNRGNDFLIPLYIESIQIIPVSIVLVQYFDCRVRKEGETAEMKMEAASARLLQTDKLEESVTEKETNVSHDVFISYAHKNPNEALLLLEEFKTQHPNLEVFFDREDLHVGGMWQKSLYYSIDSAKCVIALVSSGYLASVVCQEEFNIALYRSYQTPNDFLLILVCIEDLPSLPDTYSHHQLIDCRENKYSKLVPRLVKDVAQWVLEKRRPPYLRRTSTMVSPFVDFNEVAETRGKDVYDTYTIRLNSMQRKIPFAMKPLDPSSCHVVISASQNDLNLAACLLYHLQKISPDIKIVLMTDNTGINLKCLQTAQKIVVFLSKQYLDSDHHLEELFISVIRQRNEKNGKILHVCQTTYLEEKPAFAHLLPISICLEDKFWDSLFEESSKTVTLDLTELKGSFSYRSQDFAAMTKLADDLLLELTGHTESKPSPIIKPAGKKNMDVVQELTKCFLNLDEKSTNVSGSSPEKSGDSTKNRNDPQKSEPSSIQSDQLHKAVSSSVQSQSNTTTDQQTPDESNSPSSQCNTTTDQQILDDGGPVPESNFPSSQCNTTTDRTTDKQPPKSGGHRSENKSFSCNVL